MTETEAFRCGYVALVGRPNVGKSTLMNHLIGQKISITSSKPQTTRHRIIGIKTEADYQAVFVDTPGLHRHAKKAVNRYMNRTAKSTLADVDLIIFVVEAGRWTEDDENVLRQLRTVAVPVVLAVNKIDHIKDKTELLPLLQNLGRKMDFAALVPVSALRRNNLEELEKVVAAHLPENPPFYAEDQITDRSSRFLAAEIVREKLMRTLGQELPYELTVEIEQFKEEDGLLNIAAVIWIERDSQKPIVIGKGGSVLKKVGQLARTDMEKLFESKVYLQLWVKVKEGWSDDERALSSLGYTED
ncbi:GTPase Era [Sulfurivermis fontis]|uniref:GTPase Era n=1 Tax=Sulfurivermis fontis TaxID=1972068 RepID=UPI000FDB61B9|nr:GTPase Era [Sulfurivermis fontis]